MADAPSSEAKAWMIKAWRDLETARRSATGKPPFYDIAVYHCQQAAEKSVKAFLVHHDKSHEKTHDIEVLVDLAWEIDPNFSELADAADVLTPYCHAVSLSQFHVRDRTATDRMRRGIETRRVHLRICLEPASCDRATLSRHCR